MQKVIPMQKDETSKVYEKKLLYLDNLNMKTSALAVFNAKAEVNRMGKIAYENLTMALDSLYEKNLEKAKKTLENEKIIDYLNQSIAEKLVLINNMALSSSDAAKVGEMFGIIGDIERIGDHAENIAEYTVLLKENNLKFSETALDELKLLSEVTLRVIKKALNVYEHRLNNQLSQIDALEEKVDALSAQFVKNHIERLKTEDCEPISGVVFTDMIIDLERSSDHAKNIAFSIMSENKKNKK